MRLEVRQATEEDCELCFAITEEAMRGYVEATWGVWEPSAQRRSHAESFLPRTHWIILAEGVEVGLLSVVQEESHVQLVKLYLRSASRGQAVGSEIIHSLLAYAASRSQPLRLRVLAVNERAQAFYRRHGFLEASRTTERVFMEARPNPSIERTCQGPLRAPWPAAHVER